MKWLPLTGIAEWIDEELLTWVDGRRRQSGEVERMRKLGTTELLWLMLAVALDAGRNGLHEIIRMATADLHGINWSVTVAGFCKARARLSPPAPALPPRTPGSEAVPPPREESR